MRYIFSIIGAVVVTVSLVALGFNIRQVDQERATLTTNLEQRASLLADSLKESVEPLHNDESIVGALMVVQNAGYINTTIREIWKGNLLRLLIQIIIFSITI